MPVAPGQSPSGYGREMRGRFRRAGGAIAQIVTAHFLADFEQVAMDPQDVAAHIDKRHLRLGEAQDGRLAGLRGSSEEHTSELQSLMRVSYAVFCLNNNT